MDSVIIIHSFYVERSICNAVFFDYGAFDRKKNIEEEAVFFFSYQLNLW